jgi:hypothetical protein
MEREGSEPVVVAVNEGEDCVAFVVEERCSGEFLLRCAAAVAAALTRSPLLTCCILFGLTVVVVALTLNDLVFIV